MRSTYEESISSKASITRTMKLPNAFIFCPLLRLLSFWMLFISFMLGRLSPRFISMESGATVSIESTGSATAFAAHAIKHVSVAINQKNRTLITACQVFCPLPSSQALRSQNPCGKCAFPANAPQPVVSTASARGRDWLSPALPVRFLCAG